MRALSLSQFASDQRGTIAIMTGLLTPVLVGFMGLAVDAGFAMSSQTALQSQADAAAMATARAQSWYGGQIASGGLRMVAALAADQADSEIGAPAVEGITGSSQEVSVRLDARVPRFLVEIGDGVISAAAGARWVAGSGAGAGGAAALNR